METMQAAVIAIPSVIALVAASVLTVDKSESANNRGETFKACVLQATPVVAAMITALVIKVIAFS